MIRNWLLPAIAFATTPTFAQTNAGALTAQADNPFKVTKVAELNLPWRMAFLPDARMLITEKGGKVFLVTPAGAKTEVKGVPAVQFGGQNGLLGYLPRAGLREGSRRVPHLLRAGRRPGDLEPGARAREARPGERRVGLVHGYQGHLARPDQGQGWPVRRDDRVLARQEAAVSDGRRAAALHARAGSEPAGRARSCD